MEKTLLLVDDESDVIESLHRLFRKEGYTILKAQSGFEGLELIKKHKVDVIISDQRMPKMTGSEFLAKVKKDYPETIRIALSGYTDINTVIDAVNQGSIYKFFTKPWDSALLKDEIKLAFDQQALIEKNNLIKKAFNTTSESIVIFSEDGKIISVNPAFSKSTQFSIDDVKEKNLDMFSFGTSNAKSIRHLKEHLLKHHEWHGELITTRKDGTTFPAWMAISTIDNKKSEGTTFAGLFVNLGRQKEREKRMKYNDYHDPLTGLGNRKLLNDHLSLVIAQAKENQWKAAVLFIDLDRFKSINSCLGTESGDKILCDVASRLQVHYDDNVTITRISSDEFIILLPKIDDVSDIEDYCVQTLDSLKKEFIINDSKLHITASLGVSIFPDDGDSFDSLLKNADAAMCLSKKTGGNCFQFYDSSMNIHAKEALDIENDLYDAIKNDQLCLYYQPKRDIKTRKINGFEALIRWQHPTKGLILPFKFIPISEENGLIIPIGDWVLRHSCSQLKKWILSGFNDLTISINLSPKQIKNSRFVDSLKNILTEYELPPENIEFEITENVILDKKDDVKKILHTLKDIGVSLALDDFGTGYSSLSYLKEFPFDTLKIDQSFIRDMISDHNDTALVSAIISIAQSLNMKVVAEGVKHEEQWQMLERLQCDLIQGYLGGEPEPADVVEKWLKEP